jgi:hypothetical protein
MGYTWLYMVIHGDIHGFMEHPQMGEKPFWEIGVVSGTAGFFEPFSKPATFSKVVRDDDLRSIFRLEKSDMWVRCCTYLKWIHGITWYNNHLILGILMGFLWA